MKKSFFCFLIILSITLTISVTGCKKSEDTTPEFSDKSVTTESSSNESTGSDPNDFSLVAGIWQITESTLDEKNVNIKKYKNILTYLYNDGTVKVDNKKTKSAEGTYTFNDNIIVTNINNITSVMTVSEDYTVMTATGMSDGKKVITTYKKISN